MKFGKLIALTTTVSVLGLVVAASVSGCSDDTPVTDSADAKADRVAVTLDAAPACFSDDPIDATDVPYNSPNTVANACSEDNVTELVAWIKANPEKSFVDMQAHIKATYPADCNACIFSENTAALWGPLITNNGVLTGINGAGCVEIVSGKGNACGKAYHQWDVCIDFACQECTDDAEYTDCTGNVQTTACADASDALVAACGQQINNFIQACRGTYGIDAWIRRSCVLGAPLGDGGTDAGDAGDAGDADADAAH